uniref:Uncharacterized protein n=1 Tax=Arundo donax TaxID=35708 RepID=A0A0A9HBX7_ARUDO
MVLTLCPDFALHQDPRQLLPSKRILIIVSFYLIGNRTRKKTM